MQTPAKPFQNQLRGRLYTISDLCKTDEKWLKIEIFRCLSGFSDQTTTPNWTMDD